MSKVLNYWHLIAVFISYILAVAFGAVYVLDPLNGPYRSFGDIQKVSYCYQPGDEVIVYPGTYRETVLLCGHGTPSAPIVIRAAHPETVFVKGSDVVSNWTFVQKIDSCDIYNASVSYDILPNVQILLQIVLTKRTITLPMGDWRVDAALRRLAWVVVVVARRSC